MGAPAPKILGMYPWGCQSQEGDPGCKPTLFLPEGSSLKIAQLCLHVGWRGQVLKCGLCWTEVLISQFEVHSVIQCWQCLSDIVTLRGIRKANRRPEFPSKGRPYRGRTAVTKEIQRVSGSRVDDQKKWALLVLHQACTWPFFFVRILIWFSALHLHVPRTQGHKFLGFWDSALSKTESFIYKPNPVKPVQHKPHLTSGACFQEQRARKVLKSTSGISCCYQASRKECQELFYYFLK